MTTRRTHSLEFKQRTVDASSRPGASIAGVAMAHGINANQLHKWRRHLLSPKAVVAEPVMLPVTINHTPGPVQAAPAPAEGSIDIQFHRVRLSIRGYVDLDVLQTVLTTLRAR